MIDGSLHQESRGYYNRDNYLDSHLMFKSESENCEQMLNIYRDNYYGLNIEEVIIVGDINA